MNYRTNSTTRLLTVLAVVLGLAIAAPAASAADCSVPGPTTDQYCPSDPPPPSTTTSSSGLPFTGFDVTMAALAAVALLGAGLGIRRVAGASRDA